MSLGRLASSASRGARSAVFTLMLLSGHAQAHELADEFTLEELSAGSLRTGYIADQLEGVLELSDQWFLSAAAGLTHLAPTPTLHSADIPHYAGGLGFEPNDQLEINLAAHAPRSSLLENSGDVAERGIRRVLCVPRQLHPVG